MVEGSEEDGSETKGGAAMTSEELNRLAELRKAASPGEIKCVFKTGWEQERVGHVELSEVNNEE